MGTVKQPLGIGEAIPHATLVPELAKQDGTNFPLWGYKLDSGLDEMLSWRFVAFNYGVSNPNVLVLIDWYAFGGATTGAAVFGASLAAVTPGDAQSMETDALAAEATTTTTTSGTARAFNRTTVTITALDSLAADDSVELRLRRIGSNGADTLVGDAFIFGVTVTYLDT